MTIVTHHGSERVRERIGLPKKAVQKLADAAWRSGARKWDFSGSIRRYLDALYYGGTAHDLRVHNGFVFVFDAGTLVTAFHLPPKYRRAKPDAKAVEARRVETEGLDAKHESAVAEGDLPEGS